MKMVLNELSAEFPLQEKREGKRVMNTFLHVYMKMRKLLNESTVYLDKEYSGFYLAREYNILSWRNDPTVDPEEKRIFRSLINRSLTYDQLMTCEEWEALCDKDMRVAGSSSKGCLCGYLSRGCMLSFDTDIKWEQEELNAVLEELEGQEIKKQIVSIPNVCNDVTYKSFETAYCPFFNKAHLDTLLTGDIILKKSKDIFQNLIFCDNAKRQMKCITNPILVKQIVKKLMELQEYFCVWHRFFDKTAIKNASPESKETLRHYKKEHTFLLPDGRYEVFSWHIRFTGIEGRIFFLPEVWDRRCYIGHVGCKLPNVSYH